jgi:hypothetical protein
MIQIGNLYSCSEFYILLYPNKNTAEAFDFAATARAPIWISGLSQPISYIAKNIPFLFLALSRDEKHIQVLMSDRKGWIINADYLNLKKIT